MATVSRGEITITNVADGKPSYTHWAYAWSADGEDRFTTVYPNENLMINTQTPTSTSGPSVKGITAVANETITVYDGILRQEKKVTSTSEFYYWFMNTAEGNLALADLKPGKTYTLSLDLRANLVSGGYLLWRAQYKKATGNWINIPGWGNKIEGISGEFKRFEKVVDIPSDAVTLYFSYQAYNALSQAPETGTVVEFQKAKFEENGYATIYTPAPSDDFINAYPSYVGTYTTFDDVQSTNPADYTWQRFMGNQGEDGEDGISIVGVEVQYAQTTTSTEPTSGWSYTRPTPIPGQYLWTRTRNKFSDGTFGSWATFPTMIGRDAIVVSEIAPANPSIGTLWQKPSDPNVQKWNGTKWENWGIAPENIVADNLVVKDGRFEKLVGAELESGTITNSFDFWDGSLVPNTSAQMWRRGKTTIRNAEVTTLWEDYNKSTGAKVKEGGVIHDSNGFSVFVNDPSGYSQRSSVRMDGILIADSRGVGGATSTFLTYSDLVKIQPIQLTPATGWSVYATSGSNRPIGSRTGRIVTLSGAFKNNSVLSNSNDVITIGSVPNALRPISEVKIIAKGAGTSSYMLVVDTDGLIKIQYRLGWTGSQYGYIQNNSGDIFNIHVSYPGADIF